MKWVCFPKFYGPLANWPWLRISPQSSLYVTIIWSLLPDNNWWALPVFLWKMNPIKAHWGKGSWPFSFESSATFLPQADHVLVDLFSSVVARGALRAEPPQLSSGLNITTYISRSEKYLRRVQQSFLEFTITEKWTPSILSHVSHFRMAN